MKRSIGHIGLARALLIGALILSGQAKLQAQQTAVDINDLRAEFAESNQAARSAPQMLHDDSDDSGVSAPIVTNTSITDNQSLTKTEADLKAQEAEILRQLAAKGAKGAKPVIVVKGDERPIVDSIGSGNDSNFDSGDPQPASLPLKEKTLTKTDIDTPSSAGSLAAAPGSTDSRPAPGKTQDEIASLKGKYSALETQTSAQKKALAGLRETNESLARQVQSADKRYSELKQRYDDTQNRLMVAETEIERLSSMLEARNKSNLSRLLGDRDKKETDAAPSTGAKAALASKANESSAANDSSDVSVATVIADKVNLRTGPGKDNSPLMAVSKGTRLVVETRSGSWLRVVAPTGTRAWISSDVVDFGTGATAAGGERTVRIRGYDDSIEALAKQYINNNGARH